MGIESTDAVSQDQPQTLDSDLRTEPAAMGERRVGGGLVGRHGTAVPVHHRVEEMHAKVVAAEAQVPLALAEAFRAGSLGVMDYMKYRNIESDTRMRDSIAGTGEDTEI